ncbi:MAG: prepilin-type N-terminal cleavage/methylation domain-containing protein [Gemmatimonadales bacterium]
MLTRSRRGFTLIEVMVSLALTLVVAGALYSVLLSTQRITRAQAQRVDLQSNVRAGAVLVLGELRELSAVTGGTGGQNDILVAGSNAVVYRAMRGMGFICAAPSATTFRIARSSFSGARDPQAGRDEVLIFSEDSAAAGAADSWLGTNIVSVATVSPCPGALGPGITLTVPAGASVAGPEIGTPVRIAEVMELRLYESEGRSWLGARSVSSGEAIQPLVGPLTKGNGFGLEYLDASGTPSIDRTSIRSIRITLRGTTEGGGAGNSVPVEEELVTQVALRNAVQP